MNAADEFGDDWLLRSSSGTWMSTFIELRTVPF